VEQQNMKLYRCLNDDKILTETALKKGICAGHKLIEYTDDKETVYKIAMGIPSEGHTLPEAYDNHLLTSFRMGCMQERWRYEKRNPRYEFYWYTTARMLTQMAREKLMSVALQADCDFIIMYDDDMVLPTNMVEKLLEDMEQHPEIDIVAPLAFMRNPPHYAVMYTAKEGYDNIRHQPYYFNQYVKKYPRNVLVECDSVGFGAVCIRLSMVRKMTSPYFMSTTNTGEDIFFCVNAKKQADAQIFMDTRIKLGHLKNPEIVDEDYVDKYNKERKIKLKAPAIKYAVDSDDVDKLLALDR
jgi:hypothetical protein